MLGCGGVEEHMLSGGKLFVLAEIWSIFTDIEVYWILHYLPSLKFLFLSVKYLTHVLFYLRNGPCITMVCM